MAECCGGESELKEKGMILPPDSVDIKSGELAVDSIHCASCVNLIEGAVKGLSGIQSVRVNLTRKRASIVWDDGILSLDDIINEINSIGHTAYVYEIGEDEKEIMYVEYKYVAMAPIVIGKSIFRLFFINPLTALDKNGHPL